MKRFFEIGDLNFIDVERISQIYVDRDLEKSRFTVVIFAELGSGAHDSCYFNVATFNSLAAAAEGLARLRAVLGIQEYGSYRDLRRGAPGANADMPKTFPGGAD